MSLSTIVFFVDPSQEPKLHEYWERYPDVFRASGALVSFFKLSQQDAEARRLVGGVEDFLKGTDDEGGPKAAA